MHRMGIAAVVLLAVAAIVAGAPHPRALWHKNDVRGCVMSSVVLVRGFALYTTFDNAALYAIDATTGETAWTAGLDHDDQTNTPAVHNGNVYYQGNRGTMYAFDGSTGRRLWCNRYFGTKGAFRGAPTIGTVHGTDAMFVGTNNSFGAFRLSDGKQLWAVATQSMDAAAYGNGVVYIGTKDGVAATNANTGREMWRAYFSGFGNALLDTDDLFVGSRRYGNFASINAKTGIIQWTYNGNSTAHIFSKPAADAQRVYFTEDVTGRVHALDRATGSLVWTTVLNTTTYLMVSPTLSQGVLYIGGYGSMHTIDAETGTVTSRFSIGNYFAGENAAATLVDGVAYFGTTCSCCPCARNNSIYAVRY